jgi:hypothetical protein
MKLRVGGRSPGGERVVDLAATGCGVGLMPSISGLESIIPVWTSTGPARWSIVQTNTGMVSPSTRSSAARWALITHRPLPPGKAVLRSDARITF